MTNDWFWHRFLRIAGNPLSTAVSKAKETVGTELLISVGSGASVELAMTS